MARRALRTFFRDQIPLILLGVALFLLTFTLQYVSGARQKELAHMPDEPAHVVTALMVHDYLATGLPATPRRYAEEYYIHYPKVAIGIWPPLVYTVSAVWMFPFGVSRLSLLLLSGTLVATLASFLAFFVRRLYGTAWGLMAGVMFIAMRSMQVTSCEFMLDIAVGLAAFIAMLAMERYFRTVQLRAAVALGFAVGGAMLVKGNANALLLMIGFMLLLTGRLELLKKPGLWVTGLIVLLVGVPWQILTFRLLANQRNVLPLSPGNMVRNFQGYVGILSAEFTPLILALLLVGLVVAVWRGRVKSSAESLLLGCAASLFLAVLVFHCLVPVVGSLDHRYMTAAFAPGIVLFLAGCRHLCHGLFPGWKFQSGGCAVLIGGVLLFAATQGAFRTPRLPALGFTEVAELALAANHNSCCTMLICSDSTGEGAFISEVAMRDRNLSRIILRATKLISEGTWNGQVFRMLFEHEADLARALDDNVVDVVVVDLAKADSEQARALLLATLRQKPERWTLSRLQGDFTRRFEIYARQQRSGLVRKTIRVSMPFTLGRDIELKPR